MPELPEVETIRRELEREAVGKKVKAVEVHGTRTVRRQTKKAFAAKLDGAKITAVDRRGKYLLVVLDTGDVLVIHLRMSGQLLRGRGQGPSAPSTPMWSSPSRWAASCASSTRGPSARCSWPRPDTWPRTCRSWPSWASTRSSNRCSWQTFGQLLRNHKMKLKAFLTDQTIIAGLGNIYADEILFAAGLRYDRLTDSLSTQEIRRLYRSLVETLHDAIKYGGSTLADEQYVDLNGKPGEYQEHHKVYDREKQPCLRCRRATIARPSAPAGPPTTASSARSDRGMD